MNEDKLLLVEQFIDGWVVDREETYCENCAGEL